MKLSWIVLILFIGPSTCVAQEEIEEAFVSFSTPAYFGILQVMLESVHTFSTRPVVVYGINCDIPFCQEKFPRLIKRRINNNRFTEGHPSICYMKFPIIYESNIKYGVYIEADDIANVGVDSLFDQARRVQKFPLCPIHSDDPSNQEYIMKFLRVAYKTNPYVHGHIVFSKECFNFLKECYGVCLKIGDVGANWDETVLNVMLWKYKVKNWYLPLYDPFYTTVNNYLKGKFSCVRFEKINYFMLHGCKDPQKARRVLQKLVAHSLK